MGDNSLVDENAKTDWQSYSPVKRGPDGSIEPNGVPGIMPGPGATDQNQHWLSGLPIDGSIESFVADLKSGNYFSAVFDGLAAIMDGVALGVGAAGVETPGGAVAFVAQPLIAWILDHVQPLRLVLDELVGNPGTITGVANTWQNMGQALGDAAKQYNADAQATASSWQGDAGDAYRGHALKLAASINAAGLLCEAWQVLVQIVSDLVQTVHDLVRDLIAELIATLIEIAIDTMDAPPPIDLAELAKDGVVEITKTSAFIGKALAKVGKGMGEAVSLAARILSEFTRIANAVKYMVDFASRGGDAGTPPE